MNELQSVNFTDLTQVLLWLVSVGAVFIVNWLFGKTLAGVDWWKKLPTWVKYLVPPVVAILLGFGGQLLLAHPDIIDAIAPHFALVMTILMGYFGSQVAHVQTKVKPGVTIVPRPNDSEKG